MIYIIIILLVFLPLLIDRFEISPPDRLVPPTSELGRNTGEHGKVPARETYRIRLQARRHVLSLTNAQKLPDGESLSRVTKTPLREFNWQSQLVHCWASVLRVADPRFLDAAHISYIDLQNPFLIGIRRPPPAQPSLLFFSISRLGHGA